MSFDFAELFTAGARHIVPHTLSKRLTISFDYRGSQLLLASDAAAMKCSVLRLLCGVTDLVEAGFLIFYAQGQAQRPGKCLATLRAAGAGQLARDDKISAVLERLQLSEDALPVGSGKPRLRRATGRCPNTGASIEFSSLPYEGLLMSAEWLMPGTAMSDGDAAFDAQHARAWVIHDDEVVAESLGRRLQRLGWATSRFDTAASAARRLRAMPPEHARPSLVVAIESQTVTPTSVQILWPSLPDWTQRIYAVSAGSPCLMTPDGVPGFEVWPQPFSPADLNGFTARLSPASDTPSGSTVPTPLLLADRPLLLIADANEVSRVIATGLAVSLGYEVVTANDGLEAIEQCQRTPPAAVLMDLALPKLNGFATAQRLRELERSGVFPPCVIVAAAPGASTDTVRACIAAGMDGCLAKPLTQASLQAELRRVCAGSPSPLLQYDAA
jgi:CheY-like chemotaxis protein